MYKWVPIRSEDDFAQIATIVPEDYAPKRVAERLEDEITNAVKGILVEGDYVDKDYRSTYYHYYAKKGRHYRDDCYRLHFFDDTVSFDDETLVLRCTGGALEDHYFGYMVLRPTLSRTVGRTVLSPDIRRGAAGSVITSRHRVHVLGHTLHVWGFPSMDQHADISVCAHVACWAILRHYSQRFPNYREILLHEVTLLAGNEDPGGLAPSDGLIEMESERIFRAAGAFPVKEPRIDGKEHMFYRHMLAYIESGFSLYLASDALAHAVAVVGHKWKASGALKRVPKARKAVSTALRSANTQTYAWDQVERVLVVDDAALPYRSVPTSAPKKGDNALYGIDLFNWIVVALPEKIYYGVGAVERQAKTLYEQVLFKRMELPPFKDVIIRHFVTTTPGIRQFAHEQRSSLGDVLVNAAMLEPMAQFVWVVEYATAQEWNNGHICARAFIDATASELDPYPVWFAHSREFLLSFDRSSLKGEDETINVPLNRHKMSPLFRMERNLRPIRPRTT